MTTLAGKKIAITGGSGGIGSELVGRLLAVGAVPIILDRVAPGSREAVFIASDLSTALGIEEAGHALAKQAPDVLVNLAGIQYFGTLESQSAANIAMLYTINLLAPVLLSQAVLPGMKARGEGQIVNVGSIFGSIGFAHFATYSSAKAGVKTFSEALRRELRDTGVRVTYIAPRAVKTALNNALILELAARTHMAMDSPAWVAKQMFQAITRRATDVYLGFPESFFVRLNGLLPRLVDRALAKNDRVARDVLNLKE